MGRFRYDEVDHYGGNSGADYFSLKDDGDTARVRLMYNGIDDIEGYAVHTVDIGDRKRYVNCLRNYNDPIDVCPFCRQRMMQAVKVFIPLYNEDEGKVQIWERGRSYITKLSGFAARYSNSKDRLVSQVFEIERHGRKGDTGTTYEFYPVGNRDDVTLEDLPEIPNVVGTFVLDKTAEDMEAYLETGEFPPVGLDEEPSTPRRREERNEPVYQRRTPAMNRRDKF